MSGAEDVDRRRPVCLRRYQSPIEANIVRGLLERAGIEVTLEGEGLIGAYAGVPKVGDVRLLVRGRDEARARELVEAYESGPQGEEWTCAACGERNGGQFELCWQCGEALSPHPEAHDA